MFPLIGALNGRLYADVLSVVSAAGFAPLLYPPERTGLVEDFSWRHLGVVLDKVAAGITRPPRPR